VPLEVGSLHIAFHFRRVDRATQHSSHPVFYRISRFYKDLYNFVQSLYMSFYDLFDGKSGLFGSKAVAILSLSLVAMISLCASLQWEVFELLVLLVGAVYYALLKAYGANSSPSSIASKLRSFDSFGSDDVPAAASQVCQVGNAVARAVSTTVGGAIDIDSSRDSACSSAELRQEGGSSGDRASSTGSTGERRRPGQQLSTAAWDAEVHELLTAIVPSRDGNRVAQELVVVIQQMIRSVLPEAEVSGFATGDLPRPSRRRTNDGADCRGALPIAQASAESSKEHAGEDADLLQTSVANGNGEASGEVALPEVEIVVSVDPFWLASRLKARLARSSAASAAKLDARKIQKSAIRACTDRLVSAGGFKFRCSAFRGQEPKVTLLAPSTLGVCDEAIPIELSVNSLTPLYSAALVSCCGHLEPRAQALVFLVRRWAKDRGISHAGKGHLSPYAWGLLAAYFMQVATGDESPLLPPLMGLHRPATGFIVQPVAEKAGHHSLFKGVGCSESGKRGRRSVGKLFRDFVRFYHKDFNWCNEAVAVRSGERAAPDASLRLNTLQHEDGASMVGPTVADPFEVGHNLGLCMTACTFQRLQQELARAYELCSRRAPLAEALDVWFPPPGLEELESLGQDRGTSQS